MHYLRTHRLQWGIYGPEEGSYLGTRFDHGGLTASMAVDGVECCGPWYGAHDPATHDAVRGPAEEFMPVFTEEGPLLKIGVGLLDAPREGYDHFQLYPVLDKGEWQVRSSVRSVHFLHRIAGWYTYEKTFLLTGEASFEIRHSLAVRRPLAGEVYNHNFFTLGRLRVSPHRTLSFPFRPEGDWREPYDSVDFSRNGVRFSRNLAVGESVYSGNIHAAGQEGMPYDFTLAEASLALHVTGDVPLLRTAFWANHRIACPEPYNAFSAVPGKPFCWNIRYTFVNPA